MIRRAAALSLLTALSFFLFPGHTWLQEDTQIYVPILEHLNDPTLFTRELIAREPHVAYTFYDEISIVLRRLTGAELQPVLVAQQVLFRGLAITGVFWIALALGLTEVGALLVAATFALGATINGPTVLTLEYEPIPRAFAVCLVFFALGLLAHGWWKPAGFAAAGAMLYQTPAAYTFWPAYLILELRARRYRVLLPLAVVLAALLAAARFQPGTDERQVFFAQLDPALAQLQRMRASYNWVSTWPVWYFVQHIACAALGFAAWLRLRGRMNFELRWITFLMMGLGLLSVPASYIALERLRWALIPQFQPARALLYTVALASILAAVAGVHAAKERGMMAGAAWFAPVFVIPAMQFFGARLAGVAVVLALLFAAAIRWPRFAWVAMIVPFIAIPYAAGVTNYVKVADPELESLASWARESTPKEALFHFPDAGRARYPGWFRGEAKRAVYADWKGGGQINFLRIFATEWWPRWQKTMARGKLAVAPDAYANLGVDYVVVKREHRWPGVEPIFENARYAVYPVRR